MDSPRRLASLYRRQCSATWRANAALTQDLQQSARHVRTLKALLVLTWSLWALSIVMEVCLWTF